MSLVAVYCECTFYSSWSQRSFAAGTNCRSIFVNAAIAKDSFLLFSRLFNFLCHKYSWVKTIFNYAFFREIFTWAIRPHYSRCLQSLNNKLKTHSNTNGMECSLPKRSIKIQLYASCVCRFYCGVIAPAIEVLLLNYMEYYILWIFHTKLNNIRQQTKIFRVSSFIYLML